MSTPDSGIPQQLEIDQADVFRLSGGEDLREQFRKLSQQVVDFITLQETVIEHSIEQDQFREQRLTEYQRSVDQQLRDMKIVLAEIQELMTSAGVARFRLAAEESLRTGQEHFGLIRDETERFRQIAEDSCSHLHNVSVKAEHRVSNLVKAFRLEYFKGLVDDGCQQVQSATATTMGSLKDKMRWFHWQNALVGVVMAGVVSISLGYFINDEMPWVSHQRVVAERNAGQALIHAWPKLSKIERSHIETFSR